MSLRVLPFVVTIPANTPIATPVSVPINLDGWTIERLDLEVPPGPAGLMGFQIYNNGVAWIPYGGGEWIVWDDVQQSYYLDDQPNAGGWAVVGYNLGTFPHNVIVRASVSSAISTDSPASPPAVTIVTTPATPDTIVL